MDNATNFGALEKLKVTKYITYVLTAGRNKTFWQSASNGFMGRNVNDYSKPVHYVDQFMKNDSGNRAVMPLVLDLSGDPVANDNILEGNEEELVADYQEITLGQMRKAVRNKGRLSDRATVINFRSQAKEKLANWLAQKTDEIFFLVASGIPFTTNLDGSARAASSELPQLAFASQVSAPSTNRQLFAGTATNTATLTASDKMSWDFLLTAKAQAVYKKIKPITVDGKSTWGVVMNPFQARDLQMDSSYKTAVQNGAERGKDNPLFAGAFVRVSGLALFDHNLVANTYGLASGSKWGSGGTVDGAQAILFGAQAIGYAMIAAPSWDEESKDFGNRNAIAYGTICGFAKAVYKSAVDGNAKEDFGIMSLYTAAKQ